MVFIRLLRFGVSLGFAFLVDYFAVAGLLEHAEVYKTELKPFLTILGTRMRARQSGAVLKCPEPILKSVRHR
jgi:hypothetical protein